MYPRYVHVTMFTLLVLAVALTALPAAAQTFNKSVSVSGGGTLNYQLTILTRPCTYDNGKLPSSFDADTYGDFVYVPTAGPDVPISGSFEVIEGSNGQGSCFKNTTWKGSIKYFAKTYQVYIYPSSNGVSPSAAYVTGLYGYINPKYVVATVLYAPPGSKSTAVYTNSTTVSNTISITNSFSSSFTQSTSTTFGLGLAGYQAGTETGNQSTTMTQTTSNGTSITNTLLTSSGLTVPGPVSDYVGVDHDYDVIKVWINPVLLFTVYDTTLSGETKIEWWGYGYSALDTTAPIDIWPIPAGCLNGDFPVSESACAPPLKAFERTWAAGETWPSGQGPGLTSADLDNILAADPWGKCTPSSAIGSTACPTYSSGFLLPNFSLSDQSDISYLQPLPGDQPQPQTFQVSTTNAETDSSSTTDTYSQTWGFESVGSLPNFIDSFSGTFSESQTLTSTYQYSTSLTTSNTMTGTANVTGPACVGSPCNPSYPPASPTFSTATSFDIFIDSRFGTFAFLPSSYD